MSTPEMIPVDSSNVAKVGHDPASNELYVEFVGGGLYVYSGVDDQTFEELRYAPSVGSFLNRAIKPNFSYNKLS